MGGSIPVRARMATAKLWIPGTDIGSWTPKATENVPIRRPRAETTRELAIVYRRCDGGRHKASVSARIVGAVVSCAAAVEPRQADAGRLVDVDGVRDPNCSSTTSPFLEPSL